MFSAHEASATLELRIRWAKLIDAKIADMDDWRGGTLARIRSLIHAACPYVIEKVKWRKPFNPAGVPVWSHSGTLCTGETYRDKVKLTFAKGAMLRVRPQSFLVRSMAYPHADSRSPIPE